MFRRMLNKKIDCKFEIDEDVLQEFCHKNQTLWNNTEDKKREYIYIGFFMVEKWIPWLERKILYAKGLQEQTGAVPIILDWGHNDKLEKLYLSYGIHSISMKQEMFSNVAGCIYGIWNSFKFLISGATGEKIINMKYHDVKVGHFIYDTIIRTNQDIYTIRDARNRTCLKKTWTTYWFLHTLEKVCKKNPPIHYIFDDLVYDEGMIATYLRSKGCKISNFDLDNRRLLPEYTNDIIYWPDFYKDIMKHELDELSALQKDKFVQMADNMLTERFQAKNGNIRDSKAAFTGKKMASKEELITYMKLDPNKKNVVFCCHTLSESAHRCSHQAYVDTYTWMEETMKYVRNKNNANWIIKVHPIAAKKYGEGGVLEELYNKYKSDNLYWYPDEFNSSLIGELADVVVTIYGHVGSEYSCMGIPVILSGNAEYAGFGYTIDAFTKEEYQKALDKADTIPRLTDEQKKIAKLIFACQNQRKLLTDDIFTQEMTVRNWNIDTEVLKGKSAEELNTQTLQWIKEYSDKFDLKETDYYKAGCR